MTPCISKTTLKYMQTADFLFLHLECHRTADVFILTVAVRILAQNFNRRNSFMCLIFKIKWFYSVETQQYHTIISILVWLRVSVLSRPSSGQHFPVEVTFGAHLHYVIPCCFQCVHKNSYKGFLSLKYC
jgi:hypothetical protein